MRYGTVFQIFGESCLVAVIGYAQFGWKGPAAVMILYVIGAAINYKTKGSLLLP